MTLKCDIPHLHVWSNAFVYVTWPIDTWHASLIRVAWPIDLCDVTHLYSGPMSGRQCTMKTRATKWRISWRSSMWRVWINESCHLYKWVVSLVWTTCSTHATHCNTLQQSGGSHEGAHCVGYESVMSHVWKCRVNRVNESCHTYEWVMSHVWMSHVTCMNESCQDTCIKESCHTCEWVMSHVWMSHVTRVNKSCHTCE